MYECRRSCEYLAGGETSQLLEVQLELKGSLLSFEELL
jgi:hypothetical protein